MGVASGVGLRIGKLTYYLFWHVACGWVVDVGVDDVVVKFLNGCSPYPALMDKPQWRIGFDNDINSFDLLIDTLPYHIFISGLWISDLYLGVPSRKGGFVN